MKPQSLFPDATPAKPSAREQLAAMPLRPGGLHGMTDDEVAAVAKQSERNKLQPVIDSMHIVSLDVGQLVRVIEAFRNRLRVLRSKRDTPSGVIQATNELIAFLEWCKNRPSPTGQCEIKKPLTTLLKIAERLRQMGLPGIGAVIERQLSEAIHISRSETEEELQLKAKEAREALDRLRKEETK